MSDFTVHDLDSAPAAEEAFDRAREGLGMVPNLIGVLAEAPNVASAYLDLHDRFGAGTLSPPEQAVVLLSVARENGCAYCVAAHTGGAKMAGLDDPVIEAVREGQAIADPRLEALRRVTTAVVRERGWVGDDEVNAFLEAGFGRRQLLEVLLGVALKTLSNYTNHLADTPLDEAFGDFGWKSSGRAAAV